MSMVPDLGSDFAQKLLQDLRRRRERLGFESSASAQQQRTLSNAAAASRDASSSNSQKPLPSQKPQLGAPRSRIQEATTTTTHRSQGSNAIASAGKPRRRDVLPIANAHAIVPFQEGGGGGGGSKQKPVVNSVDVQMALALALSNGGKLQNIQLVARNGSIFFREPHGDHLPSPGAHVGGVAIGVQKLNDVLMEYSSSGAGARDLSRRCSVEVGRKLFGGAMDMEESLSMLVMLQDASDYMEGSGNGKVLLLKGRENRKSSVTPRSTSSARIVEIVDEDSEAEQAKNGKSTSNASMQIVAHKNSQGHHSPNSGSILQFSAVQSKSKISASKGVKDGSKVRVPNVIAKLMGLENLPSAKAVAEHKGTEKFVKPEAVLRKEIRANDMDRKLPIRIVASERVLDKGQHNDLLPVTPYNREESVRTTAQSNSSSHPATDKQVRQTMKELLRKTEIAEGGGGESQGVNEKIIHEDRTLTEEIKPQKSGSVGCRSDAGKKMDFLKRFWKNSVNKPVIEDKNTSQEKSRTVGKKQQTTKQLPSRDSETKSRRTREKFNKENLATAEIKAAGKNGKTDQMKRQAHSKQIDKQSMTKKAQNYREMQSETTGQNLEDKKSLESEAVHMKNKIAHAMVIQQKNDNHAEVNDISFSKPSDSTHGDGSFSEQLARVVTDSSTTGVASSDQSIKKITEEVHDPTIAVVQTSDGTEVLDQSAIAEIDGERINHTSSETTNMIEAFTKGEQQQEQQQMTVKEQPVDGLDHTTTYSNPTDLQEHKTHVVSCDSFTENQLVILKMLLKDQYLLETAKAIVRVHEPDNFVDAIASNWSDKGNDLLSDVGREVIRRKGKQTEAMVEVSMTRTANLKLRYLDDLIRELDGDIESLKNISKNPHQQSDDGTAENLQMILHRDIQNNHPDANSMWDFGWNRVSDLPIEKNQVLKDLEKNILGGIITDVARDLIGVSVSQGCSPCAWGLTN